MAKIHKRRRGAELLLQWSSTPFVPSFLRSVWLTSNIISRGVLPTAAAVSPNYSNSKERQVPLYSQLGLEIEKSLFPSVTQELLLQWEYMWKCIHTTHFFSNVVGYSIKREWDIWRTWIIKGMSVKKICPKKSRWFLLQKWTHLLFSKLKEGMGKNLEAERRSSQ